MSTCLCEEVQYCCPQLPQGALGSPRFESAHFVSWIPCRLGSASAHDCPRARSWIAPIRERPSCVPRIRSTGEPVWNHPPPILMGAVRSETDRGNWENRCQPKKGADRDADRSFEGSSRVSEPRALYTNSDRIGCLRNVGREGSFNRPARRDHRQSDPPFSPAMPALPATGY